MENPGFPTANCTVGTCPLSEGQIEYQPNIGGNAFYISIFAIALFCQVLFGIRYRVWGFLVGMFCGLVLEIVGYAARVQMHYNPFLKGTFVMYLVTLTIGPNFFTASIYLCLARIIVVFGESLSRFKPRTYTICFIFADVTSLILQAAGGAIASGAEIYSKKQSGIHIMVAGLALQVVSLLVFMFLCADFAIAINNRQCSEHPNFVALRNKTKFKAFLWSLGFATLLIFIRSSFRVAELSEGFASKLANNEVTFMILEGGMVASAVILLTVLHPGLAFGQHGWQEAGWNFSGAPKQKTKAHEKLQNVESEV